VDGEAEERLREKLAAVRVPPFRLRVQGVGTFGAKPAVIWAGVGTAHPHLFALHKRIHDALFAAHFNPELRSFRPHITTKFVAGPVVLTRAFVHFDRITVARNAQVAQPPLRSPPVPPTA